MRNCKRNAGLMIRRKGRPAILEIEKLTEELVKKVEETKQCMDCIHFASSLFRFSMCCSCEEKSRYEE